MKLIDIKTKDLRKALLWAGIEDYCPLWQAVWEINTLLPEESELSRLDIMRQLVRSLLDQGAIVFVWVDGEEVQFIEKQEAQHLINQPHNWAVPAIGAWQLCLSTTEVGEELYRSFFV